VSDRSDRRSELAANLSAVRHRIAAAADAAGRDPAEITLVAVTKTWPAQDVRLLAELGVADVGENRDQEAGPKHEACHDLPVSWHFVGQVQRNKAGSIASYADVVHSVDRTVLVDALDRHAGEHGRTMVALVQVALDSDLGRGGAPPADVLAIADAVVASGSLQLGGVMAVAPPEDDPNAAFARLAQVAAAVRARHPGATIVSAGMSGDLEAAVRHGATHVRIGTALLGPREPTFG
jgi:PLP dependent protein